jgi:hypothetical protein
VSLSSTLPVALASSATVFESAIPTGASLVPRIWTVTEVGVPSAVRTVKVSV